MYSAHFNDILPTAKTAGLTKGLMNSTIQNLQTTIDAIDTGTQVILIKLGREV